MGKTGLQEAPGDIMDYALQLGLREAMVKRIISLEGRRELCLVHLGCYIDSSLVYDFAC
jgi:hypothetical protein